MPETVQRLREAAPKSTQQRSRFPEPHFEVFSDFKETSSADRYGLLCRRLVRERLYDSACLLLSSRTAGQLGDYREPDEELSFRRFATQLVAHVTAFVRLNNHRPSRRRVYTRVRSYASDEASQRSTSSTGMRFRRA
jgi:hypothetical protein